MTIARAKVVPPDDSRFSRSPLSDLPIGVWMGSSRCRERSAIFSRRRAAEPTF